MQVFFLGGKSYLLHFPQRQENARVLSHLLSLCPRALLTSRVYAFDTLPGAAPPLSARAPLDAALACVGGKCAPTLRPRQAPARFVTPAQLVERWQWTTLWARRDLSNFDYLSLLNAASGRTTRDLSQYPVRRSGAVGS